MKLMATKKKRSMSDDHKAALAEGRTLGRAVKRYLAALESNRPKRGRKRTSESIAARLETIEMLLAGAETVTKVALIQERMDLSDELAGMQVTTDISGLEDAFVKAAKDYSESKGISYAAWREAGVSAAVLKRAGISRAGR